MSNKKRNKRMKRQQASLARNKKYKVCENCGNGGFTDKKFFKCKYCGHYNGSIELPGGAEVIITRGALEDR